ncbi:GntR family transcriptional regulator [Mycobacterium sp. C31M]
MVRVSPPGTGADQHQQLPQEVAAYLRELILSGQIKQGEFLRLEPISAALGVSNTPVREGLLILRGEGLVEQLPRRGFVVAAFSRQDVKDLFWVQALIAGKLAARAAKRISDADIERLEQLNADHRRAVKAGDAATLERLGHEFHRLINRSADSHRLAMLLGTIVRYLPNRFYAAFSDQVDATVDIHPEIVDALRTRDARSARILMRDHILQEGEFVVQNLDKLGTFAAAKRTTNGTADLARD